MDKNKDSIAFRYGAIDLLPFHEAIQVVRELQSGTIKKPESILKVAILSTVTIDTMVPNLVAQSYFNRIDIETYVAPYNQVTQEILSQDSGLFQFKPDVVLIITRLEELSPKLISNTIHLSASEKQALTQDVLELITLWHNTLKKNLNATTCFGTFSYPWAMGAVTSFIGDNVIRDVVDYLNTTLYKEFSKNFVIIDIASAIAEYGYENSVDLKFWYLARISFSAEMTARLANLYLPVFRELTGKKKKCLAVDLDNTMWGGIIGEDGLDNVQLSHDYPGNVFLDFQKNLLRLYHQGIILAICSKNNFNDAKEVFEKKPEMVISWDHFAVHKINWQDKSSNLIEIAEELNIGLDAVCFIDDNLSECEYVNLVLPEVLTFNVPKDLTQYNRSFSRFCSVFQGIDITEEDKKRNLMYADNKKREKHRRSAANLDDFLSSLNMVAYIKKIGRSNLSRSLQLLHKTNQFNLTTRRHDEAFLMNAMENKNWYNYAVSLTDKFGDNGQIGVILIEVIEQVARIDTFLLSCRILGRNLENELLAFIAKEMIAVGVESIIGEFIPSKKNELAKKFYLQAGFTKVADKVEKERSSQFYKCAVQSLLDDKKKKLIFFKEEN